MVIQYMDFLLIWPNFVRNIKIYPNTSILCWIFSSIILHFKGSIKMLTLTIKTLERRQLIFLTLIRARVRSTVFMVDFEQVNVGWAVFINPFEANALFLYLRKTSENFWLSDVF